MHPVAFEGDFLETNDGLIFDVKGILHPKDRKIAYLRYIPASFFHQDYKNAALKDKKTIKKQIEEQFDVTIEDIRFGRDVYVKLYDIPSRFTILSHFKPKYIFNSKLYDIPLQTVPIQDIKTVHAPEVFLKKKLELFDDSTLKNLVDFIQKGGNIPVSHIGLTGSSMVGLERKTSDYDLIVYGEKESINVHTFLRRKFSHIRRILSNNSKIRTYHGQSLRKLYKSRASGFAFTYKNFSQAERKKSHQFLIDGKDVFIRFIEFQRTKAILPQFDEYSFRTLGRVKLSGIIIDDSKSIFTPGRYAIKITKIASGNSLLTEDTIEIFTLRGRFLEQARNGDCVLIKGKLELGKDTHTNISSQRIMIGTNPEDLMIQIKRSSEKFS